MESVSIATCETYNYADVERAVFSCLGYFPGINRKMQKGAKVLVKANLLKRNAPEMR
jgi:uncharacterized protein (DUF362 family)